MNAKNQGFSSLEALIGLLLVSILIGSLLDQQSKMMNSLNKTRSKSRVIQDALSVDPGTLTDGTCESSTSENGFKVKSCKKEHPYTSELLTFAFLLN